MYCGQLSRFKDACEQIKSRLSPYMEANLKGRWEDWVCAAHQGLVNLSANGFSNFPEFDFDWSVGQGTVFKYFSYGVACSEVEVDTLTGDHHVVRTDIVMDVGESLNPAIDIGQIEGYWRAPSVPCFQCFLCHQGCYSSLKDGLWGYHGLPLGQPSHSGAH